MWTSSQLIPCPKSNLSISTTQLSGWISYKLSRQEAGKFLHCHLWLSVSISRGFYLQPLLLHYFKCCPVSEEGFGTRFLMPQTECHLSIFLPYPASWPIPSQSGPHPVPPHSPTLCLENSDSNVVLHSGSVSMAQPSVLAR